MIRASTRLNDMLTMSTGARIFDLEQCDTEGCPTILITILTTTTHFSTVFLKAALRRS